MQLFNIPSNSNLAMSTTCKHTVSVVDEPQLPFSVSDGSLYPILAQHTNRYDVLKTWGSFFFSQVTRFN